MDAPEYISIIIPTWNSEAWVRRAVDSVLAAADSDCEIVLVDDGSTDGTRAILAEYEDRDPRVLVVLRDSHGGVSAARKDGVMNCSGDAVVFVDSDDVMAPGAISDFRAHTDRDAEIVVCNVTRRPLRGKPTLALSGHREQLSGRDYLKRILSQDSDYMLHGKKFARRLFDVYPWDTDPVLEGIFHRALLLALASAVKGHVNIVPSSLVYTYIRRPNSLSAMLNLRCAGVERLWQTLDKLPLPRQEFVEWGLRLLDAFLMSRGLPFDNDFPPAVSLIEKSRGLTLDARHEHILRLLRSKNMRLAEARRLVREGQLTAQAPHLSFVVTAYNNSAEVRRTIESILDTGFRNIEVIVVDDGSNWEESVRINSITLRYPRVHLRKHPTHRGLAHARYTGLQACQGHAMMFVNSGDLVVAEGLLEALTAIDRGADVVLMGCRLPGSRLTGFDMEELIPSNANMLRRSETTFDALLRKVELPHSVCYGMNRTEFTKQVKFDLDVDDFCCDTVWLAIFYTYNPKLTPVDTIGYDQRRAPGKDMDPYDRAQHDAQWGETMLALIDRLQLQPARHYYDMVAYGVTLSVARSIALLMTKKLFGMWRARRMAGKLYRLNCLYDFYNRAHSPMPPFEQVWQQALAMHRP